MKINRKNVSRTLALIALYVFAVATRFLLATLTRKQLSISIDEYLYTDLARSIGTGNGLLFRGQTADYSYLTYPLFLSPIYALFPDGTDFFRLLQLWCILLMQASVFPIYGIASILFGEKGKKPLFAAAACLIVPDFIFGNIIFSECLIYPLFFTTVYLAFRELESPRWTSAVFLGVSAALLYETKPGQVVFPVVFVLMSAFWAIRAKNRKALVNAIISLLTAVALIAVFRMLIGGFFSFGLYGDQLDLGLEHIDRFLLGCFLYPVCFVLACGVGCFFYPFQRIREMPSAAKRILTVSIVSLLVLIIGTSWVINRHVYADDTIHIRYIAMFIPIMFLYTLSARNSPDLQDAERGRTAVWGELAVFAVFFVWVSAVFLLPSLSVFRDETIS